MNTKIISLAGLVLLVGLLYGFQQKTPTGNAQIEKGMIKVTILYAGGDDKTFDMDYYEKKHMPIVAVGYFYITDVAEYNKAITQNRDAVINDIKNYTNIQPVIQISEIKQVGYGDVK